MRLEKNKPIGIECQKLLAHVLHNIYKENVVDQSKVIPELINCKFIMRDCLVVISELMRHIKVDTIFKKYVDASKFSTISNLEAKFNGWYENVAYTKLIREYFSVLIKNISEFVFNPSMLSAETGKVTYFHFTCIPTHMGRMALEEKPIEDQLPIDSLDTLTLILGEHAADDSETPDRKISRLIQWADNNWKHKAMNNVTYTIDEIVNIFELLLERDFNVVCNINFGFEIEDPSKLKTEIENLYKEVKDSKPAILNIIRVNPETATARFLRSVSYTDKKIYTIDDSRYLDLVYPLNPIQLFEKVNK